MPAHRILLIPVLMLVASAAWAAPVADLYAAAVPVTERSEEARLEGFSAAMAAVLVRLTGQRGIASNPEVVTVLEAAPRVVQQYRYQSDGQLWVAFDSLAVERLLREANLPHWGANRPAVLVWLAVDWGGGRRGVVSADEDEELRTSIEETARERGLTLIWPLVDAVDRRALGFADLWGGFGEKVAAASERYGAGAVLVGRASRSAGSRLSVRWRLELGGLSEEWRGGLRDGVHGTADRLAYQFAVSGHADAATTEVRVSGIDSLLAYGRVFGYLQKLSLVRAVHVDRVNGDTVAFRLEVQGDPARLARMIRLGSILAPDSETGRGATTDERHYRYLP